mgnify:CR=1 FL=1
MINYIFGGFIIVGIVYSFITGNTSQINDVLINSGSSAISMIFKMLPLLCLWLGVMRIASSSGLVKIISKKLSRIILPLFPELDKDSDAIGYIASNITMNMLGVGNGATPFGLKAMSEMQKDNIYKS